jgi:DeoR family fructose operon transcriptional repressor
MMDAADEVMVVADSTKFGRQSISFLCELGDIDCLVVDEGLAAPWRKLLTAAEVDLQVAPLALGREADGARGPGAREGTE